MQDRTTPEMSKRAEESLIITAPPSSSGESIAFSNSSYKQQAVADSAHTDTGVSSLNTRGDNTLDDPSAFLWEFDSLLRRGGGQAAEEQDVGGLDTVTRVLPYQVDQFGGERRSGDIAGHPIGRTDTGEETSISYSIFKSNKGWQVSGDILSQFPRLLSSVGDRSDARGYDILANGSELLQDSEADTKTKNYQLTSSSSGNNGAENGKEEEGSPVLVSFF